MSPKSPLKPGVTRIKSALGGFMARFNLSGKRSKLAARFFTYGFMTLATIVISVICLALVLGYRFNNEDLSFRQGGLIQFISTPNNASIYVDGTLQNFRTPGKATYEAGMHSVVMQREGYRDWRKDISLEAGQLLWLNYTRFVPTTVQTAQMREFDSVYDSLFSPDRRWLVVQTKPDVPLFTIANVRNVEAPTFSDITIPAGIATPTPQGATSTYQVLEWNLDGRFFLVRHTAGDSINEVIRVDRERPAQAINLTAKFGPIAQVQFAGNDGNVVYALINNEVRELDANGDASDLVLPANVVSFEVYGSSNTIVYVAKAADGTQDVGMLKNGRQAVAKTYPAETKLNVDITNYFNDDYIAVSTGASVELIREPLDNGVTAAMRQPSKVFTLDDGKSVEWLYFSNNGRMLVAQNQASFTTYDLELDKTTVKNFSSSTPATEAFRWLDDYYLQSDFDDTLRIVEFDGANEHVIGPVVRGQAAGLSDNAEYIISFGRASNNDKVVLQRSDLVID